MVADNKHAYNKALSCKMVPINELEPYARNPRKNDEAVDRMVAAIKEFGFRIPVVAKSDGTIVDGHLRLKAAKKLGMDKVPVALADELTDAQIKAFRLLANQSANWAEWDMDLLKLELEELSVADIDLDIIGFPEDMFSDGEGLGSDSGATDKYTTKVATPLYEPTGKDVSLDDCLDRSKYAELVAKIEKSNLSKKEKAFLKDAATRHFEFNYQNIAEYYASKASKEMQELMEDSALVIIDMDAAIAKGYVQLSKTVEELMAEQQDEA